MADDDFTMAWHEAAVDDIVDAALAAVNAGAEEIADISRSYTPKDTGALADSTRVVLASRSKLTAEIRVGDGDGIKAIVVHEKTTLHHQVGGPKFLERASHEARIGDVITGQWRA